MKKLTDKTKKIPPKLGGIFKLKLFFNYLFQRSRVSLYSAINAAAASA